MNGPGKDTVTSQPDGLTSLRASQAHCCFCLSSGKSGECKAAEDVFFRDQRQQKIESVRSQLDLLKSILNDLPSPRDENDIEHLAAHSECSPSWNQRDTQ